MPVTVRVKKGRMLTIRQIERDTQAPPQRDFSADRLYSDGRPRPQARPHPQLSKPKNKFAWKKNRSPKAKPEGNRVGDIKRLDTRGKMSPEERIVRLVQFAEKHGTEYLENELQTHKRKVFEIEEALSRHKNARVDHGLQKLAEQVENDINSEKE